MLTRKTRLQTLAAALALGLVAGAALLAAPVDLIEAAARHSHVGDLIPAAQPPLGTTARLILAAGAAIGTALFFVALMAVLERNQRLSRRRARAARYADDDAPSLRRFDAHPDAPARRPLSAQDLPLELDMFAEPEDVAAEAPAAAEVVPVEAPEPDSIEALMARLERRLEERGGRPPLLSPETAAKVDLPLRELMNSLHRAAARGR